MKPETVINEETAFEGKIFNIVIQQAELADGTLVRRDVIVKNHAVTIIPMTSDNEVRLIRQYRPCIQKWVLELPAGGLEEGEDPAEAAPRELIEETGDRATEWTELPGFYPSPGLMNEFLYFYLATDLIPGESQPEFDEHIEVLTVPWSEALDWVREGKIEDGKTIAGLMMAGVHLGLIG